MPDKYMKLDPKLQKLLQPIQHEIDLIGKSLLQEQMQLLQAN